MLRRVLLGLVIVIGVLLVAVVGVVVGDSQAFEMAGDVTNVEYPAADGTTLVGYLAQPEAASEPRPAVLMVHEWWGLNAEIAEMEGISKHTVQMHIKNLYGKLAVHSRGQAVYQASLLGLVNPPGL